MAANYIHGKPSFLLQEYDLDSPEISRILWQLMVRYCVHSSPPLVPFSKTIHLTKFHPLLPSKTYVEAPTVGPPVRVVEETFSRVFLLHAKCLAFFINLYVF